MPNLPTFKLKLPKMPTLSLTLTHPNLTYDMLLQLLLCIVTLEVPMEMSDCQ